MSLLLDLSGFTSCVPYALGYAFGVDQAEIEDLFPTDFLARIVGRYLRGLANLEEEFDEVVQAGRPIVPQVKRYAKDHGIELELGWKVEVAKTVKTRVLGARDPMKDEEDLLQAWKLLFERLEPS